MTKTEHAMQLFSTKHSCAQAVLMAFAGDFGMDQLTASKVACAFGGGISHLGLTCGAVTGALMAIGLKHGGGPEMKEGTYEVVREFVDRFTRLHGSINCTELIGYDLGKPEQLAEAREKAIFAVRCVKYVQDAVKILEELV
ncbi:MAG: C-GCAxxG-C-C family protein [Desulfomonilia bacterium]|jgi:C_GCAxxG_C_C family probable redox protein